MSYKELTLEMPTFEALTKEKVYIIAGTGFEKLEGHTLVITKLCMVLKAQVLGGMKNSQILSEIWDSRYQKLTQMYG